jgi:purine-binding chemotaxis protein CheW
MRTGDGVSVRVRGGDFSMLYTGTYLVVGTLDEQRYALHLTAVERIVRAVAVTPLPHAPASVLGVVDVQGQALPVFSLRRRFQQPEREIQLNDRFLVAHTARRPVIVVMDTVIGVMEYRPEDVQPTTEVLPSAAYLEGVITLSDGMLFIHDLETFLSQDEEHFLNRALPYASEAA